MNIVAVMPIKLNNERFPGKNTMILGEKPLLQYELDNLKLTGILTNIFVFCSDEDIIPFLPSGVSFLKRSTDLDLPSSNFNQIFDSFKEIIDADIYVYAHATAPYISVDTMKQCINAVISKEYDSAFCATKIQDYLWQNGEPLNFDASNLPRSQDLIPIYRETSGIYVFTKETYEKYHRRIGSNPFIKEVSFKESIDINYSEDFELAKALLNTDI